MLKEVVYSIFRRFRAGAFNRKWRSLLSSRNVTLELPILLYIAYHGKAQRDELVRALEKYGVKTSVARARLAQLKNDGKIVEDRWGNLMINGEEPGFKIKLKSDWLESLSFVIGGISIAGVLIGMKEMPNSPFTLIFALLSLSMFLLFLIYEYGFSMEY